MGSSGVVYDDKYMNDVLLKSERVPCSSEALDAIWVPCSSPIFAGPTSMVNFEDIRGQNTSERPFFKQIDSKLDDGDEDFNGCFHQPEKKRRLLPEQVHFLEKSFEVDNKLEPDRKLQLAKELGLQPRQVAIWFQNRRARCKTKHIEKEYDSLKASFDRLKADYDTLFSQNENLKIQVHQLTQKVAKKPKLEPSTDHHHLTGPSDLRPMKLNFNPNVASDQPGLDATTSAKSDVIDPDSPQYYTDGNHPAASLEPADSSHAFEPDHSDFSQDEDDSLSRGFLSPACCPKLELECYDELQPNSCHYGFPVQDQGTWSWPY